MLRQQIVEEARSWIGTRFQHQGRIKRSQESDGGCDCLGLLIGVARSLRLASRVSGNLLWSCDTLEYSRTPDEEKLQKELARHLLKKRKGVLLMPGDVGLFQIEGKAQHLGIISKRKEALGLIHAYAPAGKVVEHRLDNQWLLKLHTVYEIQSSIT